MSALDIFRNLLTAPKQPVQTPINTPAPAVQNPTNNFQNVPGNTTQQSPGTASNGTVPVGNYTAPTPLDSLKDFWETPKQSEQQTAPQDLLDISKLQEAAGKADFTNQFDPAQLQAALAGGEGAGPALMSLLNQAAKIAYIQATVSAGKINQHTLTAAEQRLANTLPNQIRNTVARQDLVGENPAFAHAAVAPVIDLVTQQLQTKFPGATAQEINEKARAYLQEVAGVFTASTNKQQVPAANPTSSAKGEPDWGSW
jgi:hypothetical protein